MLTVEATHEKFDISLDNAAKLMHCEVRGFFDEEDGAASIEAYNRIISKINPKEYTLFINCTELDTSAPEMLAVLDGCFKMYQKDGFAKITVQEPDSLISLRQLKKVIDRSGVAVEIVKSM